jgi:enoyl-CoA hydratase/carnithine racemase
MSSPILLERAGQVATVTINRPERLNAMDSSAHLALSQILDDLADDDSVRVIILTGAGDRAFSVGRDLVEMADDDPARQAIAADRWRQVKRLTDRFDYPKPIIAKVRGHALGGGFEIAMACDIIIASDDAKFALPEPKRGLIPFAGGVHLLPRQIPLKPAMGYLLTGRVLDAQRAYQLGLVNEVVAVSELDAATDAWAADLIACAPLALRAIKQCVSQGLGRPLPEAMGDSYPAEIIRQESQDSVEGPRAFKEKRPPRWTGR